MLVRRSRLATHQLRRSWLATSSAPKPPPPNINTNTNNANDAKNTSNSLLEKLGWTPAQLTLSPEATARTNRFRFVPAAIVNHMCLGGIFAWSMFNEPITRLTGVLAPAASDWLLSQTSVTFSLVMGGFVWGAFVGKFLDQWGPRASCMLGALSLGGGFALASAALATQSLPLLYAGGAVWGMSLSWSYVPPVATLMRWFPDRKGFASGGCILGFGLGSTVAVPFFGALLEKFRKVPERLGSIHEIALKNDHGSLFATDALGQVREVIVATAADVRSWGVEEGVYIVGTGSTGLPETFAVLSGVYMFAMAASALVYRFPDASYHVGPSYPENRSAARGAGAAPSVQQDDDKIKFDVPVKTALKTPQFWIAYSGFGLSICGAYGILSTGKTMMADSFGTMMPEMVTAGFMGTFVALMGAANLGGRIMWSSLSDILARKVSADPFFGRKLTFSLMWGIGPPLYMLIIWSVHACAAGNTSVIPLAAYMLGVCGVLSSFGGTAATRPALTSDLFGTKNVGVLTAQQLSVVMPSAFLGPKITAYFREQSMRESATELSKLVGEKEFEHAFGAKHDHLDELIDAKTVTISRLMELVPEGTTDPTPFVYDKALYATASLQALSFITNQFLKPVPKSKHEKKETIDATVVNDNTESRVKPAN